MTSHGLQSKTYSLTRDLMKYSWSFPCISGLFWHLQDISLVQVYEEIKTLAPSHLYYLYINIKPLNNVLNV